MDSWIEEEVGGCSFPDKRLEKRFGELMTQLSSGLGESIPFSCQDWASTKAAYRFLSNDKVDERKILQGHFEATKARFEATDGYVLVLHDTTEFSFRRKTPGLIGKTKIINAGPYKKGQPGNHTLCGLLMHGSLAVTSEGLPLGFGAVKFWNRKMFKGTNALKKKVNGKRIPIENKESIRWLENVR